MKSCPRSFLCNRKELAPLSEEIQCQRAKDSFAFLTNQRFYFRMKAAVFAKTNT